MSGAERQIYNYWQDRDPAAAKDYMTMLEPQLDRRNAGELAANLREEAKTNPAAGFAQNIAGSYFAPLSIAASAVQNIKNAVTGEAMPVNAYSTAMMGSVMAQASESGLLDRVDSRAGKQILSTALSIAQVASRLPLGAAGLPFMATSAGGQAAQQAAAQGKSAADVLALGLQTAVTEYLTEKLPFDEMLKASKTGGSIVKAILKTAASEGLEEWANDYLNTLGNNFILGSESEMRQAVKGLTAKGTPRADAERQVAKEYLVWRPLQSALGGILAGGAVGGGGAAYGNYKMSKTGAAPNTSGDGNANLKKLPLANQDGSVYTGEKGTNILNTAAPAQGRSAGVALESTLTSPLGRTALEKVTGQSGTVPPWPQGYGTQTGQGSADSLGSGDMAIIMLKKLTDPAAPLSQGNESQLSPHRIYNAYLETLDELDAALKSGMTAREYAMSKGVPSSLPDEDAAVLDEYGLEMHSEDEGDLPKYPGSDPAKVPAEGYEWRGKGVPGSKHGNWYNPGTKEWLRPDLNHPGPILPHWDYGASDGKIYRIFPDGTFEMK
jgi:hypothetical protein